MGRILMIIGFIVFVLPILISLALFGLGLGTQIWVASAILAAMGMIDQVPNKAEWNVINVRQNSNLTEAYRTIVEPGKLLPNRVIRFNAIMGPSDIPNQRTGAAPADVENVVKLYAPQLAVEECARLKQVLADQCVVEETRARSISEGLFNVDVVLTFTTKESFGNVPEKTPLAIVEVEQNLVEGGGNTGRLITRSGQTEARMGLYRRAATACHQVRTSRGNCALRTITVRIAAERSGMTSVRQSGTAKLVFLQRQ